MNRNQQQQHPRHNRGAFGNAGGGSHGSFASGHDRLAGLNQTVVMPHDEALLGLRPLERECAQTGLVMWYGAAIERQGRFIPLDEVRLAVAALEVGADAKVGGSKDCLPRLWLMHFGLEPTLTGGMELVPRGDVYDISQVIQCCPACSTAENHGRFLRAGLCPSCRTRYSYVQAMGPPSKSLDRPNGSPVVLAGQPLDSMAGRFRRKLLEAVRQTPRRMDERVPMPARLVATLRGGLEGTAYPLTAVDDLSRVIDIFADMGDIETGRVVPVFSAANQRDDRYNAPRRFELDGIAGLPPRHAGLEKARQAVSAWRRGANAKVQVQSAPVIVTVSKDVPAELPVEQPQAAQEPQVAPEAAPAQVETPVLEQAAAPVPAAQGLVPVVSAPEPVAEPVAPEKVEMKPEPVVAGKVKAAAKAAKAPKAPVKKAKVTKAIKRATKEREVEPQGVAQAATSGGAGAFGPSINLSGLV